MILMFCDFFKEVVKNDEKLYIFLQFFEEENVNYINIQLNYYYFY